MRLLLLLGGLAVSVASAAISQTTIPVSLAATLRDHVKDERFEVVTSIRGLPLGVRESLQTLFGSGSLDIAESGAEWQGTDASASAPKRPMRRLIAAGCSVDHCLVYYERGGSERNWLATIFYWTPDETRFEWGGRAPGGLASLADLKKAIVSGTVKGPVTTW
jgi:hypothetical protein